MQQVNLFALELIAQELTMPHARAKLLALGFFLLFALGHAQFSQRYEDELKAVAVYLIPMDGNAQPYYEKTSSGILVSSRGYILTTFDAVRGFDHDIDAHGFFYTSRTDPSDPTKQIQNPAKLVRVNSEFNVAVLQMVEEDLEPFPNSVDFPAVAVASTDVTPPQPDQVVIAAGYRKIAAPTLTQGVAGARNSRGHIPWKADVPEKMGRALSGSAVVDDAGRLVGVMSWSDEPAVGGTPQDPQVEVIPISHAWDLLRDDAPGVIYARTESDGDDWSGNRDQKLKEVPLNQTYNRQLAARLAAEDWAVYHDYLVKIPEGVRRLTVEVDGQDSLYMGVNAEEPIHSFTGLDYNITTPNSKHTYSVDNPKPGPVYIQILNDVAFKRNSYRLSVRAVGVNGAAGPATFSRDQESP